jgi:hypothetical protein
VLVGVTGMTADAMALVGREGGREGGEASWGGDRGRGSCESGMMRTRALTAVVEWGGGARAPASPS